MRVLLDGSRLTVGGGLQVALGLLEGLAGDREDEWHVVASPQLASQVAPTLRTAFASFTALSRRLGPVAQVWEGLAALPRIERSLEPSLVFTIFGPTVFRPRAPHLMGFALPRLIYPAAEWGRDAGTGPLGRWRGRAFDAWARLRMSKRAFWVVETPTVRDRLCQRYGLSLDRVYVVPNARSPLIAAPAGASGPTHGGFRVLVPAADYSHKNLRVVPEVADRLRRLQDKPFRFVFTVPPKSSGWRRLRRQFERRGLQGVAETVGSVALRDMSALYSRSDAVFLPTLVECSTAVYPEAFAARRPLVTSRRDFATGQCGDAALYADPSEPGEAALALAALMSDPELRATLVRRGAIRLADHFPTPQEKLAQQRAVLRDVLRRANGRGPA